MTTMAGKIMCGTATSNNMPQSYSLASSGDGASKDGSNDDGKPFHHGNKHHHQGQSATTNLAWNRAESARAQAPGPPPPSRRPEAVRWLRTSRKDRHRPAPLHNQQQQDTIFCRTVASRHVTWLTTMTTGAPAPLYGSRLVYCPSWVVETRRAGGKGRRRLGRKSRR